MRILLFDYSGHPFQVQLSRALAARGHDVRHVFSSVFQTPKGNLVRHDDDPPGFAIESIATDRPFAKHSFVRRRGQEIELGRKLAAVIDRVRPDIVISSNAPLDVQRLAQRAAEQAGARFVFWLQDIYSRAMLATLPKIVPVIGGLVARHYRRLEFAMLRRSHAVVAITHDFVPLLKAKGVASARIAVVENWAPLAEIEPRPRDNAWATANLSPDKVRIVYSGTIGYKHNPAFLTALARALPEAHVHVFSEGPAIEAIAVEARRAGIANFSLAPWVAFEHLPDMLSGADVVVAMIEPEAGVYSVPSKVLTYFAVGRAILAAMPHENLAARTIERLDAGLVMASDDEAGFIAAARRLAGDASLRARMGRAGRAHAEIAFDVERIAGQFEDIIGGAAPADHARGG